MKHFSKTTAAIYLLAALALSTPVQAEHTAEMPQKLQAGTIDTAGELLDVTARGLVCDFCARALEKTFMQRDEVSGIDVDLTSKRIWISLKKGQTLDDSTVKELVTDAGYDIDAIARKPAHAKADTP